MSKYKDQIFKYLKEIDLNYGKILSIGSQEDDKRYFKSVKYNEWNTLDSDNQFRPTIQYDLNLPIVDPSGDMMVADTWGDSFDCVIMLNVWEYIYNPFVAHDNLNFFLKSGGTLITNYPFVYPQHEPKGTDYLRYAPDGVERLLYESGFNVEKVMAIKGDNSLIDYYINDGLKMRKDAEHDVIGLLVIAKKI